MDFTLQNRDAYNTVASAFSSTRSFLSEDLLVLQEYVQSKDTVIDVGCGNGRLYQLLAEKQVEYIGVDQSEELLKIAREKFPAGRFLLREMTNTLLPENIADTVFCIAAFHHLSTEASRVKTLQEMKRIVKPGGALVMLNWNLYNNWARGKYQGDERGDFQIPWKNDKGTVLAMRYYHGFMLEELHDLADQAGLLIQKQWYLKKGEPASIGTGDMIFSVFRTLL